MLANTIDEVIVQLDEIIIWAKSNNNKLGIFAVLYRTVTVKVRDGISDGFFEDGERMEKLDVIFANRYLQAISDYRNGIEADAAWRLSFRAVEKKRLLILQHLLIAMNAHINVDLGVAAAQVAPGAQIEDLEEDFMRINEILASLVDIVQREVGELSPRIALLDKIAKNKDEAIVNFSIKKARNAAWKFASRIAKLSPEKRERAIKNHDKEFALFGKVLVWPGIFINLIVWWIKIKENQNLGEVMNVLSGKEINMTLVNKRIERHMKKKRPEKSSR